MLNYNAVFCRLKSVCRASRCGGCSRGDAEALAAQASEGAVPGRQGELRCTGLGAPGRVGCSRTRDRSRLLHWQVDSLPPSHEGSPDVTYINRLCLTAPLPAFPSPNAQIPGLSQQALIPELGASLFSPFAGWTAKLLKSKDRLCLSRAPLILTASQSLAPSSRT